MAVVREDNSVNYLWLPARTFNDAELLAGAIRPWRHDPVEREAVLARHAEYLKKVRKPEAPVIETETSTLGDREAKRLQHLLVQGFSGDGGHE